MDKFLATFFCCSAVMSIITLIYIGVTPLLSKKYSSKWLYYIWLLVVIGWVIPFRPYLNLFAVPVHLPDMQVIHTKYDLINEQMNIIADGKASSVDWWLVIAGIWALGAAAVMLFHILRHRNFLKMINRWSANITDPEILHVFHTLKAELKIKKQVDLKECPGITSPMMIGFLHSVILLPSVAADPEELKFILSHEMIHLKRNDLWYKSLVLFTTAIHWFNPIVYFMARAIDIQCEISCDEMLIQSKNFEERKQYGETLIGAIRNGTKIYTTALSTDFYSPGRIIKTRILRIMDTTKKSAAIIILCVSFLAVIGSGIAYASDLTYGSSKNIQIIHIDVKQLNEKNVIFFKGPYELNAGDLIRYDITSDNNEDLYVDVIRNDTIKYGKNIMSQSFFGYYLRYPDCQVKVSKFMEGNYSLLVKFKNLEGAHCIKGTIKIIKGENK